MFEELHGFESGKALAEHLEWATVSYYGSPFREWLTAQAKTLLKEYTAALPPQDAGNQVGRAVNRFALVAMAGELATRQGITSWQEGEALQATRVCLNAWIETRRKQESIAPQADTIRQRRAETEANATAQNDEWRRLFRENSDVMTPEMKKLRAEVELDRKSLEEFDALLALHAQESEFLP